MQCCLSFSHLQEKKITTCYSWLSFLFLWEQRTLESGIELEVIFQIHIFDSCRRGGADNKQGHWELNHWQWEPQMLPVA